MRCTWEESILKTIHNNPSKKVYQYSLPRQVGASTFLVLFANKKVSYGEKVMFVVSRQDDLRAMINGIRDVTELYPTVNLDADHVVCKTFSDVTGPTFRGIPGDYDWIIVDNGGFSANPERLQHVVMPLTKPTTGHVLWIDTVG